ncbi:TrbG/VirB9 family P-type conjugative transfer protein [Rickettsia endosymbiont of Halotydeus destructor]|uniref:TrbG/VirB9 family P-type conjugative transfer protein n=1 Tax=Rickettsia endosymbiont of Halotydeus destructor TaxID=2996754 RepID=UPI003BB05D0A
MIIVRFCFLVLVLVNSFTVKAECPLESSRSYNNYMDDLAITTDNRIRTYIYNPNEVYKLGLHFGFQSHIEFAKNEEIQTIVLGDNYAWKITSLANRLFIKPLEKGIYTNMTIITNKRTYEFDISAKELEEGHEKELVYVVRFDYPKKRSSSF